MAKKQKKNKKWISWLLMVLLFVAAAVIVYLVWDAYFDNKKSHSGDSSDGDTTIVDQQTQTEEELEDEEDEAMDIPSPSAEVDEGERLNYDGEDANNSSSLTGVITYAGVNDKQLMIRVNIDQYLADGDCELQLTKDGESVYDYKTRIINSATTSTCEGFNVPVSKTMKGHLVIQIKLTSGERNGSISGEVDV